MSCDDDNDLIPIIISDTICTGRLTSLTTDCPYKVSQCFIFVLIIAFCNIFNVIKEHS